MKKRYVDGLLFRAKKALDDAKAKANKLSELNLEDLRAQHAVLNRWIDEISNAIASKVLTAYECRREGVEQLLLQMKRLRLRVKDLFVAQEQKQKQNQETLQPA
jgi:hypothetical protein